MDLEIVLGRESEACVVALRGEVDVYTAPARLPLTMYSRDPLTGVSKYTASELSPVKLRVGDTMRRNTGRSASNSWCANSADWRMCVRLRMPSPTSSSSVTPHSGPTQRSLASRNTSSS